MVDQIIWIISIWGCAAVFLGLGIYAGKRKEPMKFWAGTTIPPEKVTDITAYNQANSKMWKCYSIPFWVTGISFIWFPTLSAMAMVASATVGTGVLIHHYHKIETEYVLK